MFRIASEQQQHSPQQMNKRGPSTLPHDCNNLHKTPKWQNMEGKNVQLDIISFITVINVHANSRGNQGADRRAYAILQKIRTLHAVGRITDGPVTRTYKACLKACLCKGNGSTGTNTATFSCKELLGVNMSKH